MKYEPELIIALLARIREQANTFIMKELEKRQIRGILPAHGTILSVLLTASDPITISKLAKKVGRAKSTVTVMINKLVKENYLEKVHCNQDNRVIYIHSTPKLNAIEKDINRIAKDLIANTYGNMNEEEKQILMNLLMKIYHNMDEEK